MSLAIKVPTSWISETSPSSVASSTRGSPRVEEGAWLRYAGGTENFAKPGYRLAALPSTLIDVGAGREGINDFRLMMSTFHFGTQVG